MKVAMTEKMKGRHLNLFSSGRGTRRNTHLKAELRSSSGKTTCGWHPWDAGQFPLIPMVLGDNHG